MIRMFLAGAIALALSGCAVFQPLQPGDFESEAAYDLAVAGQTQRLENYARISAVTKAVFKAQIEQWRGLGVDVALLDEETQAYARAACGTMAALTEAVKALRALQPEAEIAEAENALTDEALDWCLELVDVLGSNAPAASPQPPAAPDPPEA